MVTDPEDPVWDEIDNRRTYDKPHYEDIVIMPYYDYFGFCIMRNLQYKKVNEGPHLIYELLKDNPKAIFKKTIFEKVKEACNTLTGLEFTGKIYYSICKNTGKNHYNSVDDYLEIKQFKTFDEAAKFLIDIVPWRPFWNNYKQITGYYTYADKDKNPCRYVYKHMEEF